MSQSSRRHTFPKVDLAKKHAIALILSWEMPYSPELAAQFGDYEGLEKEFWNLIVYRKNKVVHLTTEHALKTAGAQDTVTLTIMYEIRESLPPGKPPKQFTSRRDLMSRIMAINEGVELQRVIYCHAHFEYSDEEYYEGGVNVLMPLPFKSPYDTTFVIQGIRGVKHDAASESQVEYSFTIDRIRTERTHISLDFKMETDVSPGMVQTVLKRASAVAGSLVTKRRAS